MPIAIASIAGFPDRAPSKPEAGGGGDAFSRLLPRPDGPPDGKTMPPTGQTVPGSAGEETGRSRVARLALDPHSSPDILLPGSVEVPDRASDAEPDSDAPSADAGPDNDDDNTPVLLDQPIQPDILLPGALIIPVPAEPIVAPPVAAEAAGVTVEQPGLAPGSAPEQPAVASPSAEPDRSDTALTSPAQGSDAMPSRATPPQAATAGPQPSPPVALATDHFGPAEPTAVILPALQAFGAAMHRALADEHQPAEISTDAVGVTGIAAPATAILPAEAASASLDTADHRWPHAMARQIEKLRDQADANSTRIRLLPDALGPVDVAVRRDGDTLHVQFAAREAETRQLLADAQGRLAEAAAARGLKLGRTDISGDDANGADRQPQHAPAQPPQTSHPVPTRAGATVADPTDTRIA